MRTEARGDHDWLRWRDRDGRAAVLEGADTGEIAIRSPRERGAGKPNTESKDEAKRAHDLGSQFRGRRCAVVVVTLITIGGFARDARKAENGFVSVRIVSSGPRGRNNSRKMPVISERSGCSSKWPDKFPPQRGNAPCTGAVMLPPRALHMHFTFFCSRGRQTRAGPRTRGGSAATQAIETETPDHRAHSREGWPP
jgi:hypothetical protein